MCAVSRNVLLTDCCSFFIAALEGAIKSDTSKHRDTTPKSGERGATTVQEAAAPIHDSYVNGDTKNSSVLSTSTGKSELLSSV